MQRNKCKMQYRMQNLSYGLITRVLSTFLYIFAISSSTVSSLLWDVQLNVDRSAAGAFGGEGFLVQPVVSVFDRKGISKHVDMIGKVEAQLYSSPSGNEKLRLFDIAEGKCKSEEGDIVFAPLVAGESSFVNICINSAGEGYKIMYTLKDEHNISLGNVLGNPFNVTVGEAYQIGVVRQPGGAFGGKKWEVMPMVAVQDRGYNTITSVNTGKVSCLFHIPEEYFVLNSRIPTVKL